MSAVRIPSGLHEVLGERQSRLALVLIAAAAAAAVLALAPALADVPVWRAALAALMVADIGAGAIANLTRGTTDFYAARPGLRWVFIAVHAHLPLVALLLDLALTPTLLAWAATIIAATVVNLLQGHPEQRVVAGVLLAVILCTLPLLPEQSPVLLIVSALFALKVVYAFAVDHRREAREQSTAVPR
ncbi:MAG: hypothetical protein RJQ01_10925 [Microcella sp.]|uniref:hypothetical protein n=1 Tax=Microcella sp. TaxID=1913979 RepID=UPI003314DC5A